MSNEAMNLCWPLQMPPTPKAVLIALADMANDRLECWPSITVICERTCFKPRAVHGAIKWLEGEGHVMADRSNGRHTRYVLCLSREEPAQEMHQRSKCTGAADAVEPAQQMQRPAQQMQSPAQQMRTNPKEPSRTIKATQKGGAAAPARPEGVMEQTWADWLALRKAKRAPVTETVLTGAAKEAQKAGLTLESFLRVWCVRGSQGLEAAWLKPHERAPPKPTAADSFHGKTYTGTPEDQLPDFLRAPQ